MVEAISTSTIVSVAEAGGMTAFRTAVYAAIEPVLKIAFHISRFIAPIIVPVSYMISTVRVILSPVVWLFTIFQITRQITGVQRMLSFSGVLLMNRNNEQARCNLCDQIIYNIMTIDDVTPEDVKCDEICPMNLNFCMDICQKIADTLLVATEYPCVALKMCPSHEDVDTDENGEVECKLVNKHWFDTDPICAPSSHCYRFIPAGGGKPKCKQKKSLVNAWNHYMNSIKDSALQLSQALLNRRFCGDLTAAELKENAYCIDKPTGIAQIFDWAYLLLVFVLGTSLSIYAVETPSGDDDKHWLIFWIILLIMQTCEHITEVMLSKYPSYYFLRFLFACWLMYEGAERLYGTLRAIVMEVFGIAEIVSIEQDDGSVTPNTSGKSLPSNRNGKQYQLQLKYKSSKPSPCEQ